MPCTTCIGRRVRLEKGPNDILTHNIFKKRRIFNYHVTKFDCTHLNNGRIRINQLFFLDWYNLFLRSSEVYVNLHISIIVCGSYLLTTRKVSLPIFTILLIHTCFRASILTRTQLFKWHEAFSEDHEAIENLCLASRPSTPPLHKTKALNHRKFVGAVDKINQQKPNGKSTKRFIILFHMKIRANIKKTFIFLFVLVFCNHFDNKNY